MRKGSLCLGFPGWLDALSLWLLHLSRPPPFQLRRSGSSSRSVPRSGTRLEMPPFHACQSAPHPPVQRLRRRRMPRTTGEHLPRKTYCTMQIVLKTQIKAHPFDVYINYKNPPRVQFSYTTPSLKPPPPRPPLPQQQSAPRDHSGAPQSTSSAPPSQSPPSPPSADP